MEDLIIRTQERHRLTHLIKVDIFQRLLLLWCRPQLRRQTDPRDEPGIWEHLLVEFFRFFWFWGFGEQLLDLDFSAQDVVSEDFLNGLKLTIRYNQLTTPPQCPRDLPPPR